MKALTVIALTLALTAAAVAKPVPVSKPNPMGDLMRPALRNDVDVNRGSASAFERDYFQAPQPPFTAGGLPCGLQSAIFNKVHLAQLCR